MGGRGSAGGTTTADPLGRGGLSSNDAVREVQVENRVRDAYNDLPAAPGGYVKLSDLREHPSLSRLSRDEVDKALKSGNRKGMQLVTADNTRALTERDRRAALDVGGNPRHWVTYRPSGSFGSRAAPFIPLPRRRDQ